MAQADSNVYNQLSSGHGKQFEKRAGKFEHSSYLLDEMDEGVQPNQDGILEAKNSTDQFAGKISLMEMRMGSSKARTTTSCKIGPCLGPAALWEEVMMQRDCFGKCIREGVRQLEINDLVWIVDETVKRAHYKMDKVLEVCHGSDGRVRSALVKTEEGKLKRPVMKLAPLFYESVFREKNRAGIVGASHQQAKKIHSDHAG